MFVLYRTSLAQKAKELNWTQEQTFIALLEAEYNIGRGFHQLNMPHLAIPCYERALALRTIDSLPQLDTRKIESSMWWQAFYDLQRRAAHNLSLLFLVAENKRSALDLCLRFASVKP